MKWYWILAIVLGGGFLWGMMSVILYKPFFKRFYDFTLSFLALLLLSPALLILTALGAVMMKGNPFFVQKRPGKISRKTGEETLISLLKFRTMTNERDEAGNLLPDGKRLNRYGKFLRSTSLDELPSLLNILKGDLSIVGPRPQLVKDLVFMTPEQRKRHSVRQGLTGLAQCNGRNHLTWEQKFRYDLQYVSHITLWGDLKILFKTVFKVFWREGIAEEGMDTAEDFGDYLLSAGKVDRDDYALKQEIARQMEKSI